jgi:hypothetical protein
LVRTRTASTASRGTTASKNSFPATCDTWTSFGDTIFTVPVISCPDRVFSVTRLPFCAASTDSTESPAFTSSSAPIAETANPSAAPTTKAWIFLFMLFVSLGCGPADQARWMNSIL